MTQYIDTDKLGIWVHTWWKRDEVVKGTLNSLDQSDAAGRYKIFRQDTDQCSVFNWFLAMQEMAETYEWVVRLEDDTIVNKHLVHNVCTWPVPHVEPKFGTGFLSVTNPVLADAPHVGYGEKLKTPWRNYEGGMHFGGGMLFKSETLKKFLPEMLNKLCINKRMFSIVPSSVLLAHGLRSYFHVPSIVRIDLSIPRSRDWKVISESHFGSQPFDQQFKR